MCSCRKSRRARSVSAERVGSRSGKVRGGEARQRHRRVIGTGFWNLGKPKTERFQAFNEITFRLRTGATVAFTGGRVGTIASPSPRTMRRGDMDGDSVASGGSGGQKKGWGGRGVTSLSNAQISGRGDRVAGRSDAVSESAQSASSTGSWMRKGT